MTTMAAEPQITFFLNDSSASDSVFHISRFPLIEGEQVLYYRAAASGESRPYATLGGSASINRAGGSDARAWYRKAVVCQPLAAGAHVPRAFTCPHRPGRVVFFCVCFLFVS